MKIKYTIDNKEVDEMDYYAELDEMLMFQLVNELLAEDDFPDDMLEEEARQMCYDDDGVDYMLDGLKEDYYFDSRAGLKKDGFYEQEINGILFREEIVEE